MRVGVLHGGGPCPGANAAIEGIVARAEKDNVAVLGIPYGCRGLEKVQAFRSIREILGPRELHELHLLEGCIIGTSRQSPAKKEGVFDAKKWTLKKLRIRENIAQNRLHALLLIGGDDTLSTTKLLLEENIIPVNHIPKTIDRDLTVPSFGFLTAAARGKQFVREMMLGEAQTYGRTIVIESQGRDAGWLAREHQLPNGDQEHDLESADAILLPEFEIAKDAVIAHAQQVLRTKGHSVFAVSEGFLIDGEKTYINEVPDDHGHRRLGHVVFKVSSWLQKAGIESAEQVPRHSYRSGPPTPEDANLAYIMGYLTTDALIKGQSGKIPDATSYLASRGKSNVVLTDVHNVHGGHSVPEDLYDRKTLQRRDPPK